MHRGGEWGGGGERWPPRVAVVLHAISTGKIQAGEAGLRGLRKQLAKEAGMPVDISVIRIGGEFDKGPFIPLR